VILVNETKLKITMFPNGEQKIKIPWLENKNYITLKWESDQDFINLMFLKHYLDDHGRGEVFLSILYFPYSRMDRQVGGDLFTLKSLCKFINYLHFSRVVIHEPHSDVTPALLDRCLVINTTMELFCHFEKSIAKPDFVFYPDAGAQKRYYTGRYPNLVGNKVRNKEIGHIERYDIIGSIQEKVKNKTVVILDDLSSYGGTFIHAAKALKKLGAGNIYLIVAHAEESILKGEVFSSGLIKKVLTTDSIIDITRANDQLLINEI